MPSIFARPLAKVPAGMSWQAFVDGLDNPQIEEIALWGRSRIKKHFREGVSGAWRVCTGHTWIHDMFETLRQSIRGPHRSDRARLEAECDDLLERIEQARSEGALTDEQATQLIYDVRNERSRCFRAGTGSRAGHPLAQESET